jgi:Cu-Zn family superoxide dismutase
MATPEEVLVSDVVEALELFALPGEAVFPESIGVDPSSGDAFAGSLADGTIYRITASGDVSVFSAAGAGGRASVAGVKVDPAGRLWVAGGYEGTLDVYELPGGSLLARCDVGSRPSCVNDIAFGADGTAYVTDSFVPTLFRVDPRSLELEAWVDLSQHGVPWPDGLNLNGIVITPDGEHLVACQTNLGRFWRVSLSSGELDEVALAGGPLEHCDGLAISGSTLYVAVNARNEIHVAELSPDGAVATVQRVLTSEAFAFPTAIAVRDERLLVVNGQLDKMGASPSLPFTVVAIAQPGP